MKTKPYQHQASVFEQSKDEEFFALLWEMGCGKTKTAIDTIDHLYSKGEIDGAVILAPNGVHTNWATDEIPTHMETEKHAVMVWHSAKAKLKSTQHTFRKLMAYKGLAVLCMTYDTLITDAGKKALKSFLTKRRCIYIADESARIKTPGAKRTKTAIASAKYAPYKRILTGTPISGSAFDIYAQFRFLDAEFWFERGWNNFQNFKFEFGVFTRQQFGENRPFWQLVGFKNLEHMKSLIDPYSSRVTKDDVLDLPPKVYEKFYVELTPEQRRAYDDLKEEYMIQLEDEIISPQNALVMLLNLQQILSGFITHEGEEVKIDLGTNRLKALGEIIESAEGQKLIVWARFRRDIDNIVEYCNNSGIPCVRYDGSTGQEEREEAKRLFQTVSVSDGGPQVFVANPQAAGEGLTLHAASIVVYYSNTFKYSERRQSEDRAHRIGQTRSVTYFDLVARGTVDVRIIGALRSKQDIASMITGDKLEDWI